MAVMTVFNASLLACGGATTTVVNTAQKLGSPVHILPDADASFTADFNLQGLGVCSEGDFTLTVEWDGAVGRTRVAEIRHHGQAGPVGYAIGHDPDKGGWFVERMDEELAAKRYPLPFAKCQRPNGLRAPMPSKVLWREGQNLVGAPVSDARLNDVADTGPDASTTLSN